MTLLYHILHPSGQLFKNMWPSFGALIDMDIRERWAAKVHEEIQAREAAAHGQHSNPRAMGPPHNYTIMWAIIECNWSVAALVMITAYSVHILWMHSFTVDTHVYYIHLLHPHMVPAPVQEAVVWGLAEAAAAGVKIAQRTWQGMRPKAQGRALWFHWGSVKGSSCTVQCSQGG